MVRFAAIFHAMVLWCATFGQPGGSVSVSVSPLVSGLEWDASNLEQRAFHTMTCTASGGPSGWLKHYQWSGTGIAFSSPSSLVTQAWATSPGKRTASCYVYAYNPSNPEEIVPLGSQSKVAVAIGGPLSYEVSEANEQGEPVVVPEHDQNEPFAPWYIEYFGYTKGVDSTPSGAQDACYGIVRTYAGQPTGTTYTWSITGPGAAMFGTDDPVSTTLFVAATAGSSRGGIKVRVTYVYVDPVDSSITGSAPDDSEETPPPGASGPEPDYYSFTGHRPTRVEKLGQPTVENHTVGGVYPNTAPWAYVDRFKHQLFDQNDEGQPGVWIIERFPGFGPVLAAWNSATGQSLTEQNAGSMGTGWTSRSPVEASNPPWAWGELDNFDQIGLVGVVANAAHPDPTQYPALICTQQYYAATKNPTVGAWGILVQEWVNTMKVNSVSHEKG